MSIKYLVFMYSVLFFLFNPRLSAQNERAYYFENISIPNGLSNSEVWDMVQDKYGFLWIGTEDGLNRYDGYSIKIYKNNPDDPNSLPNNTVQSLCIDHDGNLLIGTNSGLSIFNQIHESFETILPDSTRPTSPNNNVLRLFEDSKNRIWVGTASGLYLFDLKSKMFTLTSIKNDDKSIPASGSVFAVTETSNGDIYSQYIFSGLIKYNEEEKIFERIAIDPDDPNYLSGILFLDMYEDKTGKLWISHLNGLITYHPHTKAFGQVKLFETQVTKNNASTVSGIVEDSEGNLWIGTAAQGIFRYNLRTNEIFKLPSDSFPLGVNANDVFFRFYEDDFGILWVGSLTKGLLKLDFQKEPFRLYPKPDDSGSNFNTTITSLVKDKSEDNIVWLGTNNGFFKYKLSDKSYVSYFTNTDSKKSLPSNNINSITSLNSTELWLGTANGLSRFNIKDNSFTNYDLKETDEHYSINYNFILNLTSDDYGNLWIATSEGVVKFDAKRKTTNFIREEGRNTYPGGLLDFIEAKHKNKEYLSSLLEVGDYQNLKKEFELAEPTKVLIVSVGEGLAEMFDFGILTNSNNDTLFNQRRSNEVHNYFSGTGKNRILCETKILPPGKYNLIYNSDDSHSYGSWNAQAPIDSTWWGIQVFPIDENEYSQINMWIDESINRQLIPGATVHVVKYQKDGSLLIGSNKGLAKYYISQNRIENYSYSDNIPVNNNTLQINDILIEKDGVVWLATMGGLIRFDQSSNEFIILYDRDGLPSNYLQAVQEDNYGNLWISTLNGITKFNKDVVNPIFINYDVRDGLQSYTFIQRSSFKTDNGELFFGGLNGFNAFHSGNINTQLPKINISELKINNNTVKPGLENSPLLKNILDTKEITLDYGQNNISFDFNSIHYSRPEKNKNAYMLEGFDKDGWIYTDRKFASYTNLPEGNYIFRVKGANGDGIWDETGASINIKIMPPWWRTIWAYIGYGFVFIGFIFGIDRFQRRRILKRAREAARIREAEVRAQLAEAESERKSKELEEARELQLSMLPKELPKLPHLDIAVYMKTATEVGGDYYDFHIGMDGVLTVVVGDATGHGLNAGTMVTSTKSLFNALAPNPHIIETFHEMSRCLKLMHLEKLSMCMTMLKIAGDKLTMSAAGMPPVFIYRKETQTVDEFVMKGMPLGTFSEFPYTQRESQLQSGDTILLMSDGFPELFNEKKEMFGYKTARNLFEENAMYEPSEIIDRLKDAGSEWVNDKDPDDDVTFVVLKMK